MPSPAVWCLIVALGVGAYAYLVYPLLLMVLAALRPRAPAFPDPDPWPSVSISLPAYNEEASIAATVERLLELDYPRDCVQILVVSDASSDRTEEIVRGYAGRGVELLRAGQRGGKTAAENLARTHLRGQIVVNTDASVRVDAGALKPLIRSFSDPTVGVASGRDVSVARVDDTANMGESGYVGYEMWVRSLETRVSGIVGASGSLYAIRADLHMALVPEALSRDFAAALIAHERGYRAVSIEDAVCFVPRTSRLRDEYRRKVRTMARGMETLVYKRRLMNPFRDPVFAWMIFSHKVCRWLAPWALAGGVALAIAVGSRQPWLRWLALGATLPLILALVGSLWPENRRMPALIAVPTFAVSGNIAAIHAGLKAMRGELNPLWEPTRRKSVETD